MPGKLSSVTSGAAEAEDSAVSRLKFFLVLTFRLQSYTFIRHQVCYHNVKCYIAVVLYLSHFVDSLRERGDFSLEGEAWWSVRSCPLFFKSSELFQVLLPQESVISMKNSALLFTENTCAGEASLYILMRSPLAHTEPA